MTCVRVATLAVLLSTLAPWPAAAQAPGRVDFQRDVQPILRDHCYACHGPEQQMNGFRLDRRDGAMRGGSQSVIGPGNAEGSQLYHRLVGNSVGARMPPTGPLMPEQVAVLKAWIDQGAEWPDHLSGIPPTLPVDPTADRLFGLIRSGERTQVEALLRTNPAAARGLASGGSTPLMAAALYGDADLMKRLMAMGADAGASNVAGATALMWALPDTDKMRIVLEAGVNVDARTDDRRTALVIAAGIVGAEPAAQLLLERGAKPSPATSGDPSPLREAVRVGNVGVFRMLLSHGADASMISTDTLRLRCFPCAQALDIGGSGPRALTPPTDSGLRPTLPAPSTPPRLVGATAATPAAVRAAVERSLPLLQRIGQPFIQKTGCVSCHHNSVVASTLTLARRHGYRFDEVAFEAERTRIATYLESHRERTLQNIAIAGSQDTISYLLVGLAATGHPADRATDAQALWLMRRQAADGRWPLATLRPPIESSDVEVTAMSLRAVQLYAPTAYRVNAAKAVERAGDWLASATGANTEDRAFRVLGLTWAGATREVVRAAARDLVASQRSDGGWSQEPPMDSDAYATGQALVALRESGAVPAGDPTVRRGVEYLLRTQFEDGSWFVKSRAVPIQTYFESGFPHGADQWISAAATAWAVSALVPEK